MGETAVEFPLLQLETKSSSGVVDFVSAQYPALGDFRHEPHEIYVV